MRERCLIFIPHQDDEINLVGNILNRIVRIYEVLIIYSSTDTHQIKGSIRKREALAACSVYGIDEKNMRFLDYPDTPNTRGNHFFTDGNHLIVNDIIELILENRPELLICTDFDYHSDHRMLSLAFDEAMGRVLKKEKDYRPICLKGFCYDTAFYGVEDYSAYDLGRSLQLGEVLSNASLEWDKGISIASDDKNGFIWRKRAYKGLSKHKSQYAVLHARSIINADNVFWVKRSDNLLLNQSVEIKVSSGEKNRLNDFMILDTDDIITNNSSEIDYDKAVWSPSNDDISPEICVNFPHPVEVCQIVLHGSVSDKCIQKVCIDIIADGYCIAHCNELRVYGQDTSIMLPKMSISELKLQFSYENTHRPRISEIEVFSEEVFQSLNCKSFQTLLAYNSKQKAFGIRSVVQVIDKLGYKALVFKTKIIRKVHKSLKI